MKKRTKPWKKNLDLLTPKQLEKYDDSLEVLRLMRTGRSFSASTKAVGLANSTVKKFLGNTLFKRKNRIFAKKNDNLIRNLRIYENGRDVFIQIKGNKKAKRIGQYHSAIGQLIENNNKSILRQFLTQSIKDVFRKEHFLETNPNKILEILEKHEEPEFFTIYGS